MWIERAITPKIKATLAHGKSILLFGPRQCGKTSLVKTLEHDLYITLVRNIRAFSNFFQLSCI